MVCEEVERVYHEKRAALDVEIHGNNVRVRMKFCNTTIVSSQGPLLKRMADIHHNQNPGRTVSTPKRRSILFLRTTPDAVNASDDTLTRFAADACCHVGLPSCRFLGPD